MLVVPPHNVSCPGRSSNSSSAAGSCRHAAWAVQQRRWRRALELAVAVEDGSTRRPLAVVLQQERQHKAVVVPLPR